MLFHLGQVGMLGQSQDHVAEEGMLLGYVFHIRGVGVDLHQGQAKFIIEIAVVFRVVNRRKHHETGAFADGIQQGLLQGLVHYGAFVHNQQLGLGECRQVEARRLHQRVTELLVVVKQQGAVGALLSQLHHRETRLHV